MEKAEQLQHMAVSTGSAIQKEISGEGGEIGSAGTVESAQVETILLSWPSVPQKAAQDMIAKYGLPNEVTASRLIWFNNGPWKRTIVYRDEVPHNFPKPHSDVLEQFIDYHVPPEKAAEIALYDGSVIPERTKGEVSARCDLEEMNILALNLMHDIVTGQRTVEEARRFYAETAMAFMMNRPTPYTERLLFEVPRGGTTDVDETMIAGPMAHQAVEKFKDVIG